MLRFTSSLMKETLVTYEYAIRNLIPKIDANYDNHLYMHVDGVSYPWGDHNENFHVTYIPATKEEAHNSQWLGVSRIINDFGYILTGWSHLRPEGFYDSNIIAAMNPANNKSPQLADSRGTLLQIGDYIRFDSINGNRYLGKVLSFTPKNVRIVRFPAATDIEGADYRFIENPKELTKVGNITDPVHDDKTYLYRSVISWNLCSSD